MTQEDVLAEESISEPVVYDSKIPAPQEVYAAMIALKDQDGYKEGTTWTDDEPYSDAAGYYHWKGGTINGTNIVAVGCVAFAFILSDTAFGSLPARMYAAGDFTFEDVKVGDILRVNTDTHTVIVLEVSDTGVIVAEGNLSGEVHWGRAISKDEVMRDTSHYITRYPEGYVSPDDPAADETLACGTLDTGLTWNLTNAGTLTISGSGAMPTDFSGPSEQPWNAYSSQIRKIIIEEGVTGIGPSAFYGNGALSVEIPNSVEAIGNNAFYGCSLIDVSIPSGVKMIGNDAFRQCPNLTSVTVSEGVETIGERAFRGCEKLASVQLPASVTEMGAGAFYDCTALLSVTFASGSSKVTMGEDLFARCWRLLDVTLPENMDCVSARMFQNCYLALYSVSIPQGATKIGDSAFSSCSALTALTIPDSVTDIETGAFSNCNSLKDIYFTGTEAQWKNIWKAMNVTEALANVTIHYEYNSAPDTDDGDDNDNSSTDTPDSSEGADDSEPSDGADDSKPSDNPDGTDSSEPSEDPDGTGGSDGADSSEPSEEPDGAGDSELPDSPNGAGGPEPSDSPNGAGAWAPTDNPNSVIAPDSAMAPITMPGIAPVLMPTPTPETGIPFIKGEFGKKGWEAIKEDIIDAFEGKQITVNMNGTFIVPGDVIDSIKGKDITLAFDIGNELIWYVSGENVTADHVNDVDFSVQVGTSAIPQEVVESAAGNGQTTQLVLAYDGHFGYGAVLMINMGAANAGLYANLFYYNESAGKLEFVFADQIDENGIAELVFSHASDYVIVVGDEAIGGNSNETLFESSGGAADDSDLEEAEVRTPETDESDAAELQHEGNDSNLMWLFLTGIIVVSLTGIITYIIYRKVNKGMVYKGGKVSDPP